jgi:pimeloyl-ACP methyl ester carboxylesterase
MAGLRTRTSFVGPAPRIAIEAAGRGPLVVFLHGIGGNRKAWYDQLATVAEDGFTAAAWDARGYGDSDDYDGALDFGDFARDLRRVLDELGVQRAHLVGCSMGGRISLDFYSRWPDRVATLTLADTSAGSAKVASAAEVEKFLAIRKKPLLEGRTPRDIAPDVAATLVGPGTSPEALARVIESLSELHRDSYLKTLDTVTRYTAFPPFESIRVPTFVVVGEHDRIATPEYARGMAASITGARCAVIAGGSHVSNMDRPAEFNALLLGFLREHRARADAPRDAATADARGATNSLAASPPGA